MSKFDFYLNKQGPRGPQGIQGEQGFSPIITVATDTLSEYVLQIQTQNSTFLTANLREHKDDLGGTYIRLNRETGVMYAGDADMGSQSQYGVVRFATTSDIERQDSTSVVSPADVINIVGSAPEDISRLEDRVDDLEAETESLEIDISTNSNAISELQSSVVGLLENYVPKSRTINGYNLGSNITLIANDVNAYNKSETDTLLASKANVSDLPNMNNYYNTTQIDLMLNEKADISDIPTVGNGVITINQGGVQRGQFSVNQSEDVTINLTDGGGGGGGSYIPGNGIDITNDTISTKVDGTTIDFDSSGNLTVIGGGSTPSNMVTTDTNQTISGVKTYSYRQNFDGGIATSGLYNQTGTSQIISLSSSNTNINTSSLTTTRNNTAYTVLDSGNVGTYALTSLPIATTSVLGGVIPDGTTITADANGVISASGGGSVDAYTKAETNALLATKEDSFSAIAPLTLGLVQIGKAYTDLRGYPEFTGDLIDQLVYLFKNTGDRASYFDATKPWELNVKNVIFTGNSPQYASTFISVYFDTAGYSCKVRLSGNTVTAQVPGLSPGGDFVPQQGVGYDFKLEGDGNGFYRIAYKLSSDSTYITMQSGTRALNTSTQEISLQNYYSVNSLNIYLSNVSFINDGNLLFGSERQLNLNLGTGLTVVNGALTANATPITVDQTYDPSSPNAQAGTAVAEAVSDCVQNDELVDVQVVIESSSVSQLPSFYKVFSDGTCIQGGNCTSGTAVTFLKEFANTNYINTCSASASNTTGFTPSATGSYIVFGQVNL